MTRSVRDARQKTPHYETPLGPYYSDEDRARMRRDLDYGGRHPKVVRKWTTPTKSSYLVSASSVDDGDGKPLIAPDFASTLIASLTLVSDTGAKRERWADELIKVYFPLYGVNWGPWPSIIPWLNSKELLGKAELLGCSKMWGWADKQRFLRANGFEWPIKDLDYLVDRYCDRQVTADEQGIFIGEKSFAEIQRVASALGLSTRSAIERLSAYAAGL